MKYKILIVDDDTTINSMIKKLLFVNGYKVISAFSGTEAMLLLEKEKFDLIVLDLMLPGVSGEDVLQDLKKNNSIPVIGLSAKDDTASKINLFKLGADDYITKPFDTEELLVRVQAVLRRTYDKKVPSDILEYGHLTLDKSTMSVQLNGQDITLTKNEFAILTLLMEHPKQILTKDLIYENVWGESLDGTENAINVHISNLRKKLAAIDSDKSYIKTVWGIGFKMEEL